MQTRLVAGRDFDRTDGRDRPRVAIVNETFVARLLGGGAAIGRRFRHGRSGAWIEIVGVVQDGKYLSLGEEPTPVVFVPSEQSYNAATVIVARAVSSELEARRQIRQAVRELDPALSVYAERSLSEIIALPMFPVRAAAAALAAFGAVTILLVSLGTYGLVSYSVARRTKEICVRLAVGASASDVARLVLGRMAAVWAIGAGLGLAIAFAGTPLLSPLLLGVDPRTPSVFVIAGATLAVVALVACWLPTRRALASDPAALLRRE